MNNSFDDDDIIPMDDSEKYTLNDKKSIMKKLNDARLEKKQAEDFDDVVIDMDDIEYSAEEKHRVMARLNEERQQKMLLEDEDEDAVISLSEHDDYSDSEKKLIMDKLNQTRVSKQKSKDILDSHESYSEEEKKSIKDNLNEKRLNEQRRAEIKDSRTFNKKKYTIFGTEFYKFIDMDREYYIPIVDCEKFSAKPDIMTLHYKVASEFKKKDVLIKIDMYSDKILVSHETSHIYFKPHSLEDA